MTYRRTGKPILRVMMLLAAIAGMTGCAGRQAAVIPCENTRTDRKQPDGVVYHLPKTELRLRFVIAEHRFTPGAFVEYAPRYMGDSYRSRPEVRYTIEQVTMHARGVPDDSRAYLIPSSASLSAEQLISLTPEGILYALNGRPWQPSETDAPAALPDSPAPPMQSNALPRDYALATSRAKQAEIVSDKLFELRERRIELLSGQVETMPCDGAALKMVIEGLDSEIAALEALFAGREEVTRTETIIDLPLHEPVEKLLIARFSPQYGLVGREDLSGAPVCIDISALRQLPPPGEREERAMAKSKAIRYIRPGRAKAVLHLPDLPAAATIELPVAQWGRVALIDHKLSPDRQGALPYTLYFDPASGAVETIDLSQRRAD